PLAVSVNARTESPTSASRAVAARRDRTLKRLILPPLLRLLPGGGSTIGAAAPVALTGLGSPASDERGVRDGQGLRALRERAGSGAVRAPRRALPPGPGRDISARQGVRRADGRAGLRLLRGVGVSGPRGVQCGRA